MTTSSFQLDSETFVITAPGDAKVAFTGARITEGLSRIPEIRLEFVSTNRRIDTRSFLGRPFSLKALDQHYSGLCIRVEDLGQIAGFYRYAAEVRPWLWLLSLSSDNAIYQQMSSVDILKDVFSKQGFSDVTWRTSGTYAKRDYCVQYGETHLDFISRLMEEEGIYYYFTYGTGREKLVLTDGAGGHDALGTLEFMPKADKGRVELDQIFEWAGHQSVGTAAVSLVDYDPLNPLAQLSVNRKVPNSLYNSHRGEIYRPDGHFTLSTQGEERAKVEIEGHEHAATRLFGRSAAPGMRPGKSFTLSHPDQSDQNGDYLVIHSTQWLQSQPEGLDDPMRDVIMASPIAFPEDMGLIECQFEVAPLAKQFRAPKTTPWPAPPGIQTATVTGPSGEEIYTDEHGRIKVQFHWDRNGKKDEKTTCWVRCVMPWGGKNWGMFSVPRIGMEVVIQFERGDVDRPYCTGVVYNGINKPPFPLPAEMTKTGIKTNTSKGGGGFNELSFDDKKDAEMVFLQSEKDYKEIIKNNATITIGMEKQDKGDLTQTIYRHKTESLETGNLTFTIKEGTSTTKIKGNTSLEITDGNLSETVSKGNVSEMVSQGNLSTEVKTGNISVKAGAGNISVKADGGKIEIEAAQSIELKVGGSSIKLTPAGIDIKATMINVEGTKVGVKGEAMVKVEGAIGSFEASGILTLKGSLTKIN